MNSNDKITIDKFASNDAQELFARIFSGLAPWGFNPMENLSNFNLSHPWYGDENSGKMSRCTTPRSHHFRTEWDPEKTNSED